jgi:hypothetical protein
MHDPESTKPSGHEVLREKERFERQRPEMVSRYQSFLRDFAQFRETQRQFEEPSKRASSAPATFAARLK